MTGGQGFIGAWLTERLVELRNTVTVLDNAPYEGSCAEALRLKGTGKVEFTTGDLRNPRTLESLGDKFDYIVHAAGFLGIRAVVEKPILTLDTNIQATRNILEYCLTQRNLKRIMLFSTSEVYGREAVDSTEADPAIIGTNSTRWGYAASKLAAEFYGRAYHKEHGIPVVTVRPFNVYGPHRSGSNAMTTLVERSLRGEDLLLSSDGQQTRSWCSISDFVDGLERCLAVPAAIGETFNIGDDSSALSLNELAAKIISITSSSSSVRTLGDSTPDVRSRRPVIDKARTILGYTPRIHLDDGIAAVADALRTQMALAAAR